jgi:hypothetical protein
MKSVTRIGGARVADGRRMLRQHRRPIFAGTMILGSCLFVACGGSAASDGPDANASSNTTGDAAAAAFTTWRADHIRAGCERQQRCTTPAPFSSVDECVAMADADVQAATPRIADSITRGDTKYFADAAADCLAIYESACSTSFTDILIACNKAYEGQQQLGESCVGHFECGGPSGANRWLCWEGCKSLFGYEDTLGAGQCVQGRPAGC